MYVFAGNEASFGLDNSIFTFDFGSLKWEQIEPQPGNQVPFGR